MSPDVVVVGGGLVGCSIALRLSDRGLRVTVLERSVPGAEASSVAAGILAPCIEAEHEPELRSLGIRSRELHATWAARLLDEHAIDVGFRRSGVIAVATSDEDAVALGDRAAFLAASGIRAATLDAASVRAREPALAADVRGALELPDEAQVEPPALFRAIALAAEARGVRFVSGKPVRRILVEGDRVVGVDVDGSTLAAGSVVVAAGAWTSLVPGLPLPSDAVTPVRGQLLATTTRPPLFRRLVFGEGVYVVTRPDGRVLIGATMEHVGFEKATTLGGLADLARRAIALAPALEAAPLEGHAVSFRPNSRDGSPLVGAVGPDGLYVASGHHRNGVLLAPLTAELVTSLLADGIAPPAMLDPRRLSEGR